MSMASPHLQRIRHEIKYLTHTEMLALIAELAQAAQSQDMPETLAVPAYYWRDLQGIAPDLLAGKDAQEWVNQLRDEEWAREIPNKLD